MPSQTNKIQNKIFVLLFLHTSKNHLYNHEISLISQHMFSTKKFNYYLNTPKKQQQYACSKKTVIVFSHLVFSTKKRERLTLLFLLFNLFFFNLNSNSKQKSRFLNKRIFSSFFCKAVIWKELQGRGQFLHSYHNFLSFSCGDFY